MKCFVCGKEYTGGECPRCHFPNVQLPGNYEEGLLAIKDEIEAYKEEFFGSFQIGIRTWQWIDVEGTLKPVYEEDRFFGSLLQLQAEEQWLPRSFARISDIQDLLITVVVIQGDETIEKTAAVENFIEKQLLQIGASVDEEYQLEILVRNTKGTVHRSAKISLID